MQGVDPPADRQPGDLVQGRVALRLDAQLGYGVEVTVPGRELDDVCGGIDRLERRLAGVPLDQPGDVHAGHLLPHPLGNPVDERVARQDAADVRVVEDVLHARQPETGTGDDDRLLSRWRL